MVHAVDGDTIDVQIDGQTDSLGHIGIDAPELAGAGEPGEWPGPQASLANAHRTPTPTGAPARAPTSLPAARIVIVDVFGSRTSEHVGIANEGDTGAGIWLLHSKTTPFAPFAQP